MADQPAPADHPRPAGQPAGRGGAPGTVAAGGRGAAVRTRAVGQARLPHPAQPRPGALPVGARGWRTSTTTRSRGWTPARCGNSRPAAGSRTGTPCCPAPGVGRTHLAIGLGREAVRRDYTVRFFTAHALMAALVRAYDSGELEECLAMLARPRLLIVDELGYLPMPASAAHLLFQLVSRRYERGSMLVTSNQPVSEWGAVLGDDVAATAILDRLPHHSQVPTIRGESYRLREKRRSGLYLGAKALQEPGA